MAPRALCNSLGMPPCIQHAVAAQARSYPSTHECAGTEKHLKHASDKDRMQPLHLELQEAYRLAANTIQLRFERGIDFGFEFET